MISFLRYRSAEVVYKSELYAVSRSLSNDQVSNLFSSIQRAFNEQNQGFLNGTLGLPEEVRNKVRKLEVRIVTENLSDELLLKRDYNSFFVVEAYVVDNRILNVLEESIINYINNLPYVAKRNDAYKKSLSESIIITNKSAYDVDTLARSLKDIFNNKSSSISLDNPGSLADVNVRAFELRMKAKKLETEFAVADDLQIVQSFIPSTGKFSPNTIKYLLITFALIIITFLISVLSIELIKKLASSDSK